MKLPTFDSLLLSLDNHVATITLNRPDKRNAFNDDVIRELTQAFDYCGKQDPVRAVVLTANGKAFCAGADLNWMRAMADYTRDENLADAGNLATMLKTIYNCPKPTVAAIQGDVYAGGMGLVACCDIAISVKNANFCLSEVKLGLIPATISPYVIRAIGERQAQRYFLTAERISAAKAAEIGLAHEVVDMEELDAKVEEIVAALLLGGPVAQQASKQLIALVAKRDNSAELRTQTAAHIASVRAGQEAKEGLNAFLEKRAAAWCNSANPT